MAEPSITRRLQKRFILITADPALVDEARAHTPSGWEVVPADALEQVGAWNDILLHRFLIIDADETARYDPVTLVRELRREMMVNIPVLVVGGDEGRQNELRRERADRFFTRDELTSVIESFTAQYDWG